MTPQNIASVITQLIEAGNTYDTEKYLSFYHDDAILDDPSVGETFTGHQGIRAYFESYFIGYKTQTAIRKLDINGDKAHLEVQFTGDFPGGNIAGIFDFRFKNGKIAAAKADLLERKAKN